MNHQPKIFFGCIILILTIQSCTDLDHNLKVEIPAVTISRNAVLFELIRNVFVDSEYPIENIKYIEFIHPIKLFACDTNLETENDWFISSVIELQEIDNNIASIGLCNFYCRSAKESVSKAKCINVETGEINCLDKNSGFVKTRVIRYF